MSHVTVVIATRNRRSELLSTLTRLEALPERPDVVVVDNGSDDDTVRATLAAHPQVRVVPLGRNAGAPARNVGVHASRTPYVAFSDDDSWWEPGALSAAEAAFDDDPRLGLIAARTLVGPERHPDAINAALSGTGSPPPVLGFLACASLVRRSAFLEVGGFSRLLFFVGEERLLAYDLAAAGWRRRYLPEVVAVHEPSTKRAPAAARRRLERRNEVLTAWLRRPLPVACASTARLLTDTLHDTDARHALVALLPRLPEAFLTRRVLPHQVELSIRSLS